MQIRKTGLLLACTLVLAACSVPRGAALQSEILREQDEEITSFQVVEVTRAAMPLISRWPETGWHGHYHWLDANGGNSGPVIRPGDRIDLVIWDGQDNSLLTGPGQKSVSMPGLEVSEAGSIFVPYVENVPVSGLTPSAARARIQSRLENVVPSVQVQLSIAQGPSSSVDLVAGARTPGTYPLPGRNYSVLSLIAAGGGIAADLRNPRVRLIRGSKTYVIDADTLFSSGRHNTTLYPGDKVVIEEDDRTFTALGASGVESLIPFPNEDLNALEALSLMGGLSDSRADPEGVLVLRDYPASALRADDSGPAQQQVIFSINLTTADGLFAARQFRINPDDTVLATESPVVKTRTILSLFGSVIGFGTQASNVVN